MLKIDESLTIVIGNDCDEPKDGTMLRESKELKTSVDESPSELFGRFVLFGILFPSNLLQCVNSVGQSKCPIKLSFRRPLANEFEFSRSERRTGRF